MSEVAGIRISHPDRVIFREPRITKQDIARYFDSVSAWMLPHVQGRPLTLVRCPESIDHGCQYMRHSNMWGPPALRRVNIQERTKVGEYLIADSREALVSLAQMGIVEIHTWNVRDNDVERPDRLVFDLDPGEAVTWTEIISAARTVRDALHALDLKAYVKTTGGRGLHIVVPLKPHASWNECLEFARGLSVRIARSRPDVYTLQYAKAGRSDRILLDYLRNNRTNTSIAAYSLRARPGAPVSTPVRWDELRPALDPRRFSWATTAITLARRRRGDPWEGYSTVAPKLTRQLVRAVQI